jgi:hypothetical protein
LIIFYNHFQNYYNVEHLFIGLWEKEWKKLVGFFSLILWKIFFWIFKELKEAENRIKDLMNDYKQYEENTIENEDENDELV